MNLIAARERMAREQLERRGINNPRVLEAMRAVARDRFLAPELAEHAYDDSPLPIGSAQTIAQPYMVALICEVAALERHERVLEIGTGSGYQSAVLARLCGQVYSVETIATLHARARATLSVQNIDNVELRLGDGSAGWPERAPFDAVIVTAAMPGIPRPLLDQLASAGRMVAPIGEDELQTLVRIKRRDGVWREEYFGECRFVKMTGKHGFSE